MLTVYSVGGEFFDEEKNKFRTIRPKELKLEHSLLSLSKWESRWHKPFLTKEEKTAEEMRDYIRCMSVGGETEDWQSVAFDAETLEKIRAYIDDPMTATWFKDRSRGGGRKVITAEVIYYWMIALQIPFSCEKWHLNRLMTLIRVCDEENAPKKKMSRNQILQQNHALNAARRAKMGTRG